VHLHEGENPLLQEFKHGDLHCMKGVGLREVAHEEGKMSNHDESLVNMDRREFGIGCLGVGIGERSIYVVILPGVLLVRRGIISKFVLWTLAPKINMSLEMM